MDHAQFLIGAGGFVFGLLVTYLFIIIKKGLASKNK
jgi:hypothetical protein